VAASRDAQRLFARILTRKGPWIRIDKLVYAEVVRPDAALRELVDRGLVVVDPPAPADRLLATLTVAELEALFDTPPRLRKTRLITDLLGRHSDRQLRARLFGSFHWLALEQPEALMVARLLYFGDLHQDHTTFVLEDLGVVRHEHYPLAEGARRFEDRPALVRHLRLRQVASLVARCDEVWGLAGWLVARLWPEPLDRYDRRIRDRALNALGRRFERRGEPGRALECYGRSTTPPARERRARILNQLGDRAGCATLLAEMRASPADVVEEDFSERFLVRGGGVKPPVTVHALGGRSPERIEAHAMSELEAKGAHCWHVENALPRSLAALAFWDVVFAPVDGVFVNPFQSGPVDLHWPDFATTRADAISARVARLSAADVFANELRATFEAKQGVANALAHLGWLDRSTLELMLDVIPHRHLLALASRVIRDPANTRTGFPDLLVLYRDGRYEFVEVKGPMDQLQPAQRMWFKYLLARGYPARVLKYRA
jgi:hypothetical protein